MTKLRILLADDHATVRDGLRLIVNAQPDMEVVGEAEDGRAAVAQARALAPDIVIMDLSMPQLSGLQATEALKECCPDTKVVTLTRHPETGYLRQLLRAGVSGYVLKQSRSAELLNAIRAVAAGRKYLDPAVAEDVVNDYGRRPQDRPTGHAAGGITAREEEVVRLMAQGHSNKAIAAQLGVSVKTVETHKANAMQKLGFHSRIEVVRFAVIQGWLDDA